MSIKIESHLQKLLTGLTAGTEVEIKFCYKDSLDLSTYVRLLKYISIQKGIEETTLDMLAQQNNDTYRLTIIGYNNINEQINNFFEVSTKTMLKQLLEKKKSWLKLIKKTKLNDEYVYIDEYDCLIKKAIEKEITELNISDIPITLRYKERLRLMIIDNDDITMSIDLTSVKTTNSVKKLNDATYKYELELDLTTKKAMNANKYIGELNNNFIKILKFIQQSNIIIDSIEKNDMLSAFNTLLYNNTTTKEIIAIDLPVMILTSFSYNDIYPLIANKYSVTDKADGDRHFLFIYNQHAYLISMTLAIKKLDEKFTNLVDYDNTILDGEYLYIPLYKKYIFLAFDILAHKGINIQEIDDLKKRHSYLNDVLYNVFNIKQHIESFKKNDFSEDTLRKYYNNSISAYFETLFKLIAYVNIDFIYHKHFIFPIGLHEAEIYLYASILWDNYIKKCPYKIDGLVFTPLMQKYTKYIKDMKFKTLKWKPVDKNSIDFYVQLEKDKNTKQILNVFDNTINKHIYQIARLYVDKKTSSGADFPVLFKQENDIYNTIHLYLDDGIIKDIEGNPIADNTVIECAYNNDQECPIYERWMPIRTRYDKTYSVIKYKKKYGNNENVANNIWETIEMPVTMHLFNTLSNFNTFTEKIKELKQQPEKTNEKTNIYYQLATGIAKPMREFNNWIKSNMINIYCERKTVLDMGVGRGGDIQKYYHANSKLVVGIDIDSNGIFSKTDGAITRYNDIKDKFRNVPKMTFLVANVGIKLTYNDQLKYFGSMTNKNRELLDELNTQKFNVVNCQFMLHYLFANELTFDNYCDNINKYLKKGGYLLITTFDGSIVNKLFGNATHITEMIDDITLFDIVKKYNSTNIDKFGLEISIHNSMFMKEGEYISEYIVDPSFLISNLNKKCGLVLIESEMFDVIYNNYEEFFTKSIDNEKDIKVKKYLQNIKTFYNKTPENKASFNFMKLNRLYVFYKI